jgi:hypothetical protein
LRKRKNEKSAADQTDDYDFFANDWKNEMREGADIRSSCDVLQMRPLTETTESGEEHCPSK